MAKRVRQGQRVQFTHGSETITGVVKKIHTHRGRRRCVILVDSGGIMAKWESNLLHVCDRCDNWKMWHENRQEPFCPVCER